RNPTFAGLVYRTFQIIGEAMHWRARNVRGWLALKTGRADNVRWPDRHSEPYVWVPHGTGPSDMGQAELEAFWEDGREIIRRDVVPHVDNAEIAEQITWRIDDLRQQ